MARRTGRQATTQPATLDVPLYPRSAHVLLTALESINRRELEREPQHVQIDIDNFRNQLRAHLQRVSQGA